MPIPTLRSISALRGQTTLQAQGTQEPAWCPRGWPAPSGACEGVCMRLGQAALFLET